MDGDLLSLFMMATASTLPTGLSRDTKELFLEPLPIPLREVSPGSVITNGR